MNRRTLVLLLSGSMLCQVTGCAAAVVPVALSLLESSLISALLGGVL
ncbi:MAG: hypothetical protein ACPGXK_06865 [Phycisphaerae bacterium]